MGKTQKKFGKNRLDKFYRLAKEQGYRARSAFKLIQLNKKYGFLENARCTIDLCAAPGGWLQVAAKYMPVNSLILGVDLDPIKPIPRCITFVSDITTTHCRNQLRNEMKDWKADVVLHDGAPNVGTAWIQDAYSQSELVLMSLKLAVEFLTKGGTFVTKVFRSVDYNSLIWVFQQLFSKVEATKPPSSRNVSAEIFVVCRDFLAPKFIDPKFLDPKHVFKEFSALAAGQGPSVNDTQSNVFHPEKKRRHRSGYADGDYTLYHTVSATKFIHDPEPIVLLGTFNKITFETDEEKEWLKLDLTKEDIEANCNDLKVLGKGDFKALLKWRLALREELGLDVSVKPTIELTEVIDVTEDVDEEQQLQDELERLNAEASARQKRERRRANEIRTRTIQRMQLQMTAPLDIGLEQSDAQLNLGQDDIFDLEQTQRGIRNQANFVTDADGDIDLDDEEDGGGGGEDEEDEEVLDSDEERERKVSALEADIDNLYDAYQERLRDRDLKYKAKEARRKNAAKEEWHGVAEKDSDDDDSDAESEGGYDLVQERKLDDGGGSSDESSDEESDSDVETSKVPQKKRRTKAEAPSAPQSKRRKVGSHEAAPLAAPSGTSTAWFKQDLFNGVGDLDVSDDDMESVEEEEDSSEADDDAMSVDGEADSENDDDFEVVPQDQSDDDTMWDVEDEDEDEVKREKIKKQGLTSAEAVTLAQMLVNREKTKTELINDGFNRYSLNSKDDLPSWFLEEEAKHYKPNIPITKEAIAAIRAKQRALDARPIKKVAEAKGRKKMKAAQKLEKAMKKAEGVISTTDMTEREKAQQIEKLMRKGNAKGKEKKEVKVVVARGSTRGIKGRPKGVKGRYLMVDSRGKKELRAKKRREKANKKRK